MTLTQGQTGSERYGILYFLFAKTLFIPDGLELFILLNNFCEKKKRVKFYHFC